MEKQRILRRVFQRIVLKSDAIAFEISPGILLAMLADEHAEPAKNGAESDILTIGVPIELKRRGIEGRVALQEAATGQKEPMLIGMIARGHLHLEALTDDINASHADVAARFDARTRRQSHPAYGVPVAEDYRSHFTGQQPVDLSIGKLTRTLDLPIGWKEQHALLMDGQ